MIVKDTPKHWRVQFDSLTDLVRWVSETPAVWSTERYGSRSTGNGRDWDLGVGYERALELARDGWEEGVRKIAALSATVPNGVTYEQRYGVAGERPDVPRYLAGDPFNMVHRGKARKPKPSMTLVVSYGANCHIDAKAMWNYGAALTALIDRLEARHVRVEVVACWRSTSMGNGGAFSAAHTVKRAEDHLDLSAVAFSLAHPAMLRRLAFAVMERSRRDMQTSNYGVSSDVIQPADMVDPVDGALYIGGVGSNLHCNTVEGALAYAKRKINEAAGTDLVELEDAE